MTTTETGIVETLSGARDWEVSPCVDRLGHVTSWDVVIKPDPDATGVAVIASVYSGEAVARAMLAAVHARIAAMPDTTQLLQTMASALEDARNNILSLLGGFRDDMPDSAVKLFQAQARQIDTVLAQYREQRS